MANLSGVSCLVGEWEAQRRAGGRAGEAAEVGMHSSSKSAPPHGCPLACLLVCLCVSAARSRQRGDAERGGVFATKDKGRGRHAHRRTAPPSSAHHHLLTSITTTIDSAFVHSPPLVHTTRIHPIFLRPCPSPHTRTLAGLRESPASA
jgi:hypothetical protein